MHRFKSLGRMYSKFHAAFPKNPRHSWAPPSSIDGEDHIQKLFNLNRHTFRAEDLQQYIVPKVHGGRTPNVKASKVPSVLKLHKSRAALNNASHQSSSSISKKPAKLNTKYVIDHANLKPYRVKVYQDNIIQGSDEIGNRLRRRIANKLRSVEPLDEPNFDTSLTRKAKNKIQSKAATATSAVNQTKDKPSTSKLKQQTNLFNETIKEKMMSNKTVLHAIQAIKPKPSANADKVVINKPKIEVAPKRTNFRNEVTYRQPVTQKEELNRSRKPNLASKDKIVPANARQVEKPGNAYLEIKEKKVRQDNNKPTSGALPVRQEGVGTENVLPKNENQVPYTFPHILANREAKKIDDKFITEGKNNNASTNKLELSSTTGDDDKATSEGSGGVTKIDIKKRPDVVFSDERPVKENTVETPQIEVIMSERTSTAFEEHQAASAVYSRTNRILNERAEHEHMVQQNVDETTADVKPDIKSDVKTSEFAEKKPSNGDAIVEPNTHASEPQTNMTDGLPTEMAKLDNEVILIEHQLQDVMDNIKSKASLFERLSKHTLRLSNRIAVPVKQTNETAAAIAATSSPKTITVAPQQGESEIFVSTDLNSAQNRNVETVYSTLLNQAIQSNIKMQEPQKAGMSTSSTAQDTGTTRPLCSGDQSSSDPCAASAKGKDASAGGGCQKAGNPCASKSASKSTSSCGGAEDDCNVKNPTESICAAKEAAGGAPCGGAAVAKPAENPCAAKGAANPCEAKAAANPCAAKKDANPCAAKAAANPCAAKKDANPCAAKAASNPCASGAKPAANPCAAKKEANPCAAKGTADNPCAAKEAAANPCAAKKDANPCAAKGTPANPCAADASKPAANPCAAKAAANPCAAKADANPCAAKKDANPCAAKGSAANPCAAAAKPAANPCAAKADANPCAAKKDANPCAAKGSAANPCAAAAKPAANPCAAKADTNPCAAKAASNPCAAKAASNPCAAKAAASNPCAAKGAAANPCAAATKPAANPCAAKADSNPCAAKANPCAAAAKPAGNPCAAKNDANPCVAKPSANPCGAEAAAVNPCAAAKPANPCASAGSASKSPCGAKKTDPCASKNPCATAAAKNPCAAEKKDPCAAVNLKCGENKSAADPCSAAKGKAANPCAASANADPCAKQSIVQGTSEADKEALAKKICGINSAGGDDAAKASAKCGPKCPAQTPKCPAQTPKSNPCAPKCPTAPPKCIDGMSDRTKPDGCGKVPIPCIPADQPKCGSAPTSGPCGAGKKSASGDAPQATATPPVKVSPCPLFGQKSKEVVGEPPNPAEDTTLHTKKDPLAKK